MNRRGLYDRQTAAEYLACSPETIDRLIRSGELSAVVPIGMTRGRRISRGDLERFARRRRPRPLEPRPTGGRLLRLAELEQLIGRSPARLAELAGVSERTATRWRHAGTIPEAAADAAACSAGLHPLNVWPDWYGRA